MAKKTKKSEEKMRVYIINPLRAEKYGENHQRHQTVQLEGNIARKAIKNGDAKEI